MNQERDCVIGAKVQVVVDRPLGSTHPQYKKLIYPINYGYIRGVLAGDGMYQDCYILGENKPIKAFEGVVIAIIHRKNDAEDKWVVTKDGINVSDEEILKQTEFQEQYFDIEIMR